MCWPDANHCLYQPGSGFASRKRGNLTPYSLGIPLIKPDPRQDHQPPQAHICGRTPSSTPGCPTAIPDGGGGQNGISLIENIVSFNIYLEVYITFGLFKNISTFYRLFSCSLLYLTFIFSLYINFKGVTNVSEREHG